MSCKAGDSCSTIASGVDLCDTENLHHVGALQTFLFACRPRSSSEPACVRCVRTRCQHLQVEKSRPAHMIPPPICPLSGNPKLRASLANRVLAPLGYFASAKGS